MKTQKLFVMGAIAAALTAISCEKTDLADNTLDEGTPINVALKIGGIGSPMSKALQADPGATIMPVLNDGVVFFYDNASGTIWGNEAIVVADITGDDGQIFEKVSSKADMIYIVGNIPTDELTTLKANTTVAALKGEVMNLSNQSGVDPKAVVLSNTTMASKAEFDAEIKLVKDDEYEAKVLLAPVLSRVQFADVQTDDDRITSFEVAGVYIDNYHANYNPSSENFIATAPLTVNEDGSLLGTLENQPKDVPASAVGDTDGKVAASDFDSAAGVFAYNVTPSSALVESGEYTPAIIIKLENISYTDVNGDPQTMAEGYLTVSKYIDANGEIKSFEPGTMYNIPADSFVFDLSDITDDPNQPNVQVTVFAEVCPWTITNVTPYL